MEALLIPFIVFFAVFTQAVTGFGIALVSMPLLVPLIGLPLAAPLVALVSLLSKGLILIYYRGEFTLRAVWRLMLGAVAGIPVGLLLLENANRLPVEPFLGVVLIAYALYVMAAPAPPPMRHPAWGFGLGFLSGILAGAYNTGGPPAVVYANGQNWQTTVFKANLQMFAMVNSPLVVMGHFTAGNLTVDVLSGFLLVIPALILGVLAGFALDGRIKPLIFRRLVLVLLILLGLRLLF
jgi:uncharacterized membrane protein YfcA